jgi:hypothetical protein
MARPSCQEQKTECIYYMCNQFYASLQVRNLNVFNISHYTLGVHCKNFKIKSLLTQKSLEMDQKFQQIRFRRLVSIYIKGVRINTHR